MKGSGGLVMLVVEEVEDCRMADGAGNSCGVARSVVQPPFIWLGWCEASIEELNWLAATLRQRCVLYRPAPMDLNYRQLIRWH
jgi:hypothetical protein